MYGIDDMEEKGVMGGETFFWENYSAFGIYAVVLTLLVMTVDSPSRDTAVLLAQEINGTAGVLSLSLSLPHCNGALAKVRARRCDRLQFHFPYKEIVIMMRCYLINHIIKMMKIISGNSV